MEINLENINSKIFTIRGVQVMLDRDLAELYGITTFNLNKAVKRNIDRFPEKFMFKLTDEEFKSLRFQNGMSKQGGRRYSPYVFTEQGVAMLSAVLRSKTAIIVSIQVMEAFVSMRKFISSNAQIFYRVENLERKSLEYDQNFRQIFDALQDKIPEKGIFFDGQVFDAYKFVSDIIRRSSKSIILIDNYVDDTVLTLLSKRKRKVQVRIFTKNISKQLALDLKKYNSQYARIEVKEFRHSHDRFLIIDDEEIYHFGASLKDLGKKWFGFSRFNRDSFDIINKLPQNL